MPRIRIPGYPRQHEFTDEQEKAMGQIVADFIGSNIQSGVTDSDGYPYLAIQQEPNGRVRWFYFMPGGTVDAQS